MKLLIQKDPKRFMLDFADSSHFVNKKNNNGWTALYIAAKNGNLDAVKCMIEHKADPMLKCQVQVIFSIFLKDF